MVSVRYYTDPACPWSWGIEPQVRKLMSEFGDSLGWTFVMGGLARDLSKSDGGGATIEQVYGRLIREWLVAASETDMPFDPLLWVEGPITTTYPACMAVEAAAHQAPARAGDSGYRYLRLLREGLICERRKLDHVEALAEEARAAALDVERFRLDLRSHGTTEALASDLDAAGELAERVTVEDGVRCSRGAGGAPMPTLAFSASSSTPSTGGDEELVVGLQPYEAFREAALAAGADLAGDGPPSPLELVARFGRVSTKEVEVVCELDGPRAAAELFRLAEQWKLRPLRRLTGYLWEAA